jgi:hypothetical protein
MHSDHVLLVSKNLVLDGKERCRSVPSFVHHIPSGNALQDKVVTSENLGETYRKRVHFLCTSCVENTRNHKTRPTDHAMTPSYSQRSNISQIILSDKNLVTEYYVDKLETEWKDKITALKTAATAIGSRCGMPLVVVVELCSRRSIKHPTAIP